MAVLDFLLLAMYIMGLSLLDVCPSFLNPVDFSLPSPSSPYYDADTIVFIVKTGRWAGVVTAFITMSGVKDEIDWEFPGANTTLSQSNYFWQGVIRTSIFFSFPCFYI